MAKLRVFPHRQIGPSAIEFEAGMSVLSGRHKCLLLGTCRTLTTALKCNSAFGQTFS